MEVSGLLSGGAPVIKAYQVAATMSNVGAYARAGGGTSGAGLILATTTSVKDGIGVTLNAATYTTTQGTGADSAERLVRVIINPDAILRIRMSGGATAGTALTLYDVTTASSGGTAVTTGDDWSSTTFDEGAVFGYDGANIGQLRKLTSVSSTAGTVVVPFDYATVVGDNFLRAPYWAPESTTIQLTSNLVEADASIAVGTGALLNCVDLEFNDVNHEGRTNSFVHALNPHHHLAMTASDT